MKKKKNLNHTKKFFLLLLIFIIFRFWMTKGIEMSICAIDLKMNDLDCQKISKIRSPAPVYHKFNITQKFMVKLKKIKIKFFFNLVRF